MKSHQVFDNIYSKQANQLDQNLTQLHDHIKSQAHSIYYDRKVEYVNLVETMRKLEQTRSERLRMQVQK